MLNDDLRRLRRFVDSAEPSYAKLRTVIGWVPPEPRPVPPPDADPPTEGDADRGTVVETLRALGMKAKDAERVVNKVWRKGMSVQEGIRAALAAR